MAYVLFALVWVLNFGISVWNAYAVGKVWVEAKHAGGWRRFMCWMGAVMSASGFTWCYLSFLALTAHYFQWLTEEEVLAVLNLGYVLLLPFMLFAGYAITLDSWAQAYRNGGFLNYGAAAWNTYASIHNTYSAWRNLGGAFSSLGNFFKDRRSNQERPRRRAKSRRDRDSVGRSGPVGRCADNCGNHPPGRSHLATSATIQREWMTRLMC